MNSNNKDQEKQNAVENVNEHLTLASEKVAANRKIIYWGIGAVCVVAAFVLSYLFIYRNPRLNNSWEDFNKVQLQQAKGELTGDSLVAVAYGKVASKYGSTPAANAARLASAEAYYNVKNYAAALRQLEDCDFNDPLLDTQATVLKADCYVNTKKYDQALSAYADAIKKADGNPEIVPMVLVKEANVYDAQKKYDKALECYEMIRNSYPKFQLGQLGVDAYIEREKARLGK